MNNSTINELKERREKILCYNAEQEKHMYEIQKEYQDGREVRLIKISELNEAIYILENPHTICGANAETPIVNNYGNNKGQGHALTRASDPELIIRAIGELRSCLSPDATGALVIGRNDVIHAKIVELTNLL